MLLKKINLLSPPAVRTDVQFSEFFIGHSPSQAFPHGEGGSRVPRKRETDEGNLPLPMGEVPPEGGGEGEFTISVTS